MAGSLSTLLFLLWKARGDVVEIKPGVPEPFKYRLIQKCCTRAKNVPPGPKEPMLLCSTGGAAVSRARYIHGLPTSGHMTAAGVDS